MGRNSIDKSSFVLPLCSSDASIISDCRAPRNTSAPKCRLLRPNNTPQRGNAGKALRPTNELPCRKTHSSSLLYASLRVRFKAAFPQNPFSHASGAPRRFTPDQTYLLSFRKRFPPSAANPRPARPAFPKGSCFRITAAHLRRKAVMPQNPLNRANDAPLPLFTIRRPIQSAPHN